MKLHLNFISLWTVFIAITSFFVCQFLGYRLYFSDNIYRLGATLHLPGCLYDNASCVNLNQWWDSICPYFKDAFKVSVYICLSRINKKIKIMPGMTGSKLSECYKIWDMMRKKYFVVLCQITLIRESGSHSYILLLFLGRGYLF